MGKDFTSEDIEVIENSEKGYITLRVNLLNNLELSVLENFGIIKYVEMAKKDNKNIENILSEKTLTFRSYFNFILLLFVKSDLKIEEYGVINSNNKNKLVKNFGISFNKEEVNKNLARNLNFLYQKKNQTSKIFHFNLKEFPQYPNLREFFDSIIPKLTRYNENYISYNKMHSKLSITMDYKEIFVELWHFFRQEKYLKISRRIDQRKMLNSYIRKKNLIKAIPILSFSILSTIYLLMLYDLIPAIINIEMSFFYVIFLPTGITVSITLLLISKLKKKYRRMDS